MVIPQTFGGSSGRIFNLYNWDETIANIGYKEFLALKNTEGEALVTSELHSYSSSTTRTSTGSTEFNFDHEFLAAATIGGTGFIEFTQSITADAGGTQENISNAIRLIHVKGAVETEIMGTLTKTWQIPTGTHIARISATLTIPKTTFAIGDKLRLEFIFTTTENTVGTFKFYHQPDNTGSPGDYTGTTDAARTDLKLTIPFKIYI